MVLLFAQVWSSAMLCLMPCIASRAAACAHAPRTFTPCGHSLPLQNGIAVILVVLAKKIFPDIVKFDRFDMQVRSTCTAGLLRIPSVHAAPGEEHDLTVLTCPLLAAVRWRWTGCLSTSSSSRC